MGEREQGEGILFHHGGARHGESGGCGGDERVGEVLGRYMDEDDDHFLEKTLAAFSLFCFLI